MDTLESQETRCRKPYIQARRNLIYFTEYFLNPRKIEAHESEHIGSYTNAVNCIKLLNTGEIRERYETCRLFCHYIFFVFILFSSLLVGIHLVRRKE